MYDIVDLLTGELIEGGFETYASAARYFEGAGMDYDEFGIVKDSAEGEEGEDDWSSYPGWAEMGEEQI